MNSMKSTIIHIQEEENINNLVQIIEQASKKLNIKTISQYAKDNNMSYNGVKNNRNFTTLGGVKFVVDGLSKNNLPF